MLAMNAGFASVLRSVVAIVSIAPAEKPIMPMRSGSTCHFAALVRASAKAALASAICGALRLAMSAGDGRVAGAAAPEAGVADGAGRVVGAGGRENVSKSAG